ncbi:hypothetical protein T492DRAFT_847927 [Pavlovales sp. CCMP2436]|nr:hypothetical protein T492DRAFT_847927 [Pavlovales sp. CCMP2436]
MASVPGPEDALERLWPTRPSGPSALNEGSSASLLEQERRLLLVRLLALLPIERLRLPLGIPTLKELPVGELRVQRLLATIDAGESVDLRPTSALGASFSGGSVAAGMARTGALAPELSPGLCSLARECEIGEDELRVAAYECLLSLLRWEALEGEAADALRTIRSHLGISARRHRELARTLDMPARARTGEACDDGHKARGWVEGAERARAEDGRSEVGPVLGHRGEGGQAKGTPSAGFELHACSLLSWRLELLCAYLPCDFETDDEFNEWQQRQTQIRNGIGY